MTLNEGWVFAIKKFFWHYQRKSNNTETLSGLQFFFLLIISGRRQRAIRHRWLNFHLSFLHVDGPEIGTVLSTLFRSSSRFPFERDLSMNWDRLCSFLDCQIVLTFMTRGLMTQPFIYNCDLMRMIRKLICVFALSTFIIIFF